MDPILGLSFLQIHIVPSKAGNSLNADGEIRRKAGAHRWYLRQNSLHCTDHGECVGVHTVYSVDI